MNINRRKFLQSSALASTSLYVPSFLKGLLAGNGSRIGKTLVVIQLSGGNDGLNTIVPFRNDLYYKLRPSLGLKGDDLLKVSSELGFNAALQPLRKLYDNGEMSIINSVGYPNPDRSHFRSMDIWHTASGSDEYKTTGWIGRYLDSDCPGTEQSHHALEVDSGLSLAMKGDKKNGYAMANASQLRKTTGRKFLRTLAQHDHNHEQDNVAYLYKTLIDTQSSADYLIEKSKVHDSTIDYPKGSFGKDLKQISELMTADAAVKVYYVSLGGFDTHASQQNKQTRLLTEYAEGVAAFIKDLKKNKLFDDTLILTFSEFGRRVKQNASQGTDHGTANNAMLFGGQLKQAGFYNEAPNLSDLDDGDLKYQIDFRRIYASILDNWLDANSQNILDGRFQKLGFI